MAIFNTTKKDLDTLIKEARNKKEKVSQQIKSLEVQKKDIELQIEQQTEKLVTCELEGDEAGRDEYQKNIKGLRTDLADFDGRINAYRKLLQNGVLNDKESNEIRAAIKSKNEDILKRIRPLNEEKDRAEKQIRALQDRIKEIESEVSRTYSEGNYVQQGIKNILDCIDPRTEKLDWREKEQFIKNWIGGAPTEHFFQPEPERKGPTYTERSITIYDNSEKEENNITYPYEYRDKHGNRVTEYLTNKQWEERQQKEKEEKELEEKARRIAITKEVLGI